MLWVYKLAQKAIQEKIDQGIFFLSKISVLLSLDYENGIEKMLFMLDIGSIKKHYNQWKNISRNKTF